MNINLNREWLSLHTGVVTYLRGDDGIQAHFGAALGVWRPPVSVHSPPPQIGYSRHPCPLSPPPGGVLAHRCGLVIVGLWMVERRWRVDKAVWHLAARPPACKKTQLDMADVSNYWSIGLISRAIALSPPLLLSSLAHVSNCVTSLIDWQASQTRPAYS